MIPRCVRIAGLVALLGLGPSTVLAFETVDTMLWPSSGAFPAYPGDEPRPWGLRAYAGTMYDTNVTRIPVNERSDWITRVGLGANYAARVYGRQSVVLDAYGEYRDYQEINNLDHFAYGTTAEWLWEVGNSLAGTAGWRRVHRLAELSESLVRRKQMITEDRLDLGGGYILTPDFRLTGGVGALHVDRDNTASEVATIDSWAARGGIQYVSTLGNTLGVEVRYGEGDAPLDSPDVGIFFPTNRYTARDVALTAAYVLSPDLRLRGRLGQSKREYTDLPGSNFEGTTGRGALEWRLGVKTLAVVEAFRQADPIIDANAVHVDRRGVVVGVNWAATVKLVFGARYTHERRIYEGVTAVAAATGLPPQDDTLHLWRFNVGWEPERHWQLSGSLDFGDRESNILGQNYDYTAATVNLRYSF